MLGLGRATLIGAFHRGARVSASAAATRAAGTARVVADQR